MSERMFVAFAGGGAKGLIHLGALRALEARGVTFKGLAGTSAGAIVAALKASGINADEMLNPSTGQSIIQTLTAFDPSIRSPRDFFGRMGWRKVLLFRQLLPFLPLYGLAAIGLIVLLIFAAGWSAASSKPLLAVLLLCFTLLGVWLLVRSLLAGLARTRTLSNAIGTLLQQRLFPNEPGRIVVMGDFGKDGRPTLKIVSANLTLGRLQLFSPERTPNVPVAYAVAASISLPIIFEPLLIESELHMDGGIVSNLPAWSFDEERELDPDAMTLAIEIQTATERRLLSKFNWLSAFITTGLFGSAELNLRAAGRAERLLLETSLSLLQFDLSTERAIKEVLDAERAAGLNLDKWLFRRPEMFRNACKTTKALVDDVLESVLEQADPRVRVAIAIPDKGYFQSLRLRYSTGYENDHDEAMLIPIADTVAGQALQTGDTWFEVAPLPDVFRMDGPEHRLRRKAWRQDLKWILCVPISIGQDKAPRFVVQIDGATVMPQDGRVDTVITRIENDVKEFFGLVVDSLNSVED